MIRRNILLLFCLMVMLIGLSFLSKKKPTPEIETKKSHWFILHRTSNKEEFFYGVPGDKKNSDLLKTFVVKTGIPGERPTPLPKLIGREYWKVIKKEPSDNPETSPYFITLDVPGIEQEPYGPVPYNECHGQCNWELPGAFGLHGVASDPARLSRENPGSSGCIRHSDRDITYLYNVLQPEKEEIRYYVETN